MKEDAFTDRLNDYIDDTLPADDRDRTRLHLESCRDCRQAERELRAIRAEARGLGDLVPPERVWQRISAELASRENAGGPGSRSRSLDIRVYLGLAAAVVLAIAIFLLEPRGTPDAHDPGALVSMVTAELQAAETHYDRAIQGLEQIVAQNDGVLNEELDVVLSANLDLIERAIVESREAMRTEPDSTVAQESLLEALRRKVRLLQSTILLINEVRKGEGENALELIDEMREDAPSNPI